MAQNKEVSGMLVLALIISLVVNAYLGFDIYRRNALVKIAFDYNRRYGPEEDNGVLTMPLQAGKNYILFQEKYTFLQELDMKWRAWAIAKGKVQACAGSLPIEVDKLGGRILFWALTADNKTLAHGEVDPGECKKNDYYLPELNAAAESLNDPY